MADRAEQAGDEAGAEEHEDRDPVRGRREHDRAEQRERDHDHDAGRRARLRARRPAPGHQWSVSPTITSGEEVDGEHVGDADRGRAEEAREEQRRAADGPHDERLQQAALGVTG